MDKHTVENSISTLKQVLVVYQGQLSTSVIEELKVVIAALEDSRNDQGSDEELVGWIARALLIIAEVIRVVTDISDWMK